MANKQRISLLSESLGCISSLDTLLDFLSLEVISIKFIYAADEALARSTLWCLSCCKALSELSLKTVVQKGMWDFHRVSEQSLGQVLVTHAVSPSAGCASSCPQNCLCLWYPLIYPIRPVCGAACEMGHVIGLIIMGGGHCLILGLLLT